jgi:hypothetical protein
VNGNSLGISVVVLTHCNWDGFRLLLRRLRAQTMAARLELIVVAPSRKDVNLESADTNGLWGYQILELGAFEEGPAKAAGARAARAPLVAFTENHSFPDPAWAETLINAHEAGEYAAIGPVMRNANPGTAASWGAFLVFYGFALGDSRACEVESVPGNQSCYRRAFLVEGGAGLDEAFQSETTLQWELRSKGHRLLQHPGARVYHMNFSRFGPSAREFFHSSRLFAYRRAQGWGTFKRMCYGAGSPLLPAIRAPRLVRQARAARVPARTMLRAVPAALLILTAGALGEMLGYATGPGRASEHIRDFDQHRHLWYVPSDVAAASRT